jgi:hypothetical protein
VVQTTTQLYLLENPWFPVNHGFNFCDSPSFWDILGWGFQDGDSGITLSESTRSCPFDERELL